MNTKITISANDVKTWLEKHGAHDVKQVSVSINGETWQGCEYKRTLEYTAGMDGVRDGRFKAGEKYTETAIYCVGKLPKVYDSGRRKYPEGKVCFPASTGVEWYVCCYIRVDAISETFKEFHPFGANFILGPWNIPNSKVDDGERKPYARHPLTVQYIPTEETRARLEYLRGELRAERISYGQLAELQGLAEFIPADDVELREAAGLPEKV